MIKKLKSGLLIILGICFWGCENKADLSIKLPNGEIILKTTIVEIEKLHKCKYEQYVGFILNYKDTLLTNPVIIMEENNNLVGSDVLNEQQIKNLKQTKIEAIKFTYTIPEAKKTRDTIFENYIKNRYKDFDEVENIKDGFELKKSGNTYVRVELHTIAIPNYSILIYPTK